MISSDKRIRLCIALLVMNLAFIWGNSLLPGELSAAFSDWIREILTKLLPNLEVGRKGTGLLRKIAHFTEFCTLGMCLGWLAGMLARPQGWALAGGVLAACIDETIQVFVPDRGPSLFDVGIDSCGVLTGIALLQIGYSIVKQNMKE
ncbi:MAG: VanZ family protein [Oscillospiraceae bacterium]|jgi:VanZ family protein|nr:VanZ family protein [Oscillospiraceae bacterium]